MSSLYAPVKQSKVSVVGTIIPKRELEVQWDAHLRQDLLFPLKRLIPRHQEGKVGMGDSQGTWFEAALPLQRKIWIQ